jgi:hypothetical protein
MLRRDHSLKPNPATEQDQFVAAAEERLDRTEKSRERPESEQRFAPHVFLDSLAAGLRL